MPGAITQFILDGVQLVIDANIAAADAVIDALTLPVAPLVGVPGGFVPPNRFAYTIIVNDQFGLPFDRGLIVATAPTTGQPGLMSFTMNGNQLAYIMTGLFVFAGAFNPLAVIYVPDANPNFATTSGIYTGFNPAASEYSYHSLLTMTRK